MHCSTYCNSNRKKQTNPKQKVLVYSVLSIGVNTNLTVAPSTEELRKESGCDRALHYLQSDIKICLTFYVWIVYGWARE